MSSVERRRPNDRLWQAMTAAGVNSEQLAKKVGVNPKTVERWLMDGRPPFPVHRHAVVEVVGSSVEELWPGQSRRRSPDANEALREAIYRARLTPEQVAEKLEVDAKTVERWIAKGRLPYSRHRAAVSELVDVPETQLWPEAHRELEKRMAATDPAGVWHRWAEQQIQAQAAEMRQQLGLTRPRSARDDERARTLADYAAASAPIKEADIHPHRHAEQAQQSRPVEVPRYRPQYRTMEEYDRLRESWPRVERSR
ncbi:helix-turn-helix domain-containing protein [Nocardia niwae]|uniref:helix-turn-helix domain-containing protein n=1 Tax=Nocardia niwae TaxID=626084 RepID=UPI000A9C3877|nr:helix-turn-helix domain-containing protein [Nocardia niwae]